MKRLDLAKKPPNALAELSPRKVNVDLVAHDDAEPAGHILVALLHDQRYDRLVEFVGVLRLRLAIYRLTALFGDANEHTAAVLDSARHRVQATPVNVNHVHPDLAATLLQLRLHAQASLSARIVIADHDMLLAEGSGDRTRHHRLACIPRQRFIHIPSNLLAYVERVELRLVLVVDERLFLDELLQVDLDLFVLGEVDRYFLIE